MAPTQTCASYQYVVTSNGPKILPVEDQLPKDEESPADYNSGGYLPVKVGDTFKNGRYRVVRKLGWGHFSTVWLVRDVKLKHHSALKVVKSAGRYAETARDEIKLLSRVAAANLNHPGRSHVVSFLDSFYYEGIDAAHVCIVFEPLGENLLAIIERHKKTGVPIPVVRSIAKQILLGLQYLHDECDLVHTDIKPENILISIPDVEQHILDELSQSPIPTSRRVGVPPVPKGRVGVVIPQGQHRSRRQVQIFESQPISSPKSSRSIGRYGHNSLSMSTGARPGPSESVPSSVPGSFVQMHISRLTSTKAMSASHPAGESNSSGSKPRHSAPAASAPSTKPGANHISPSTSSSSSSLNSTLESSNAGTSSIISTPPTSLSNSIGNVVSGFIGLSKASASISKQFGGADPTPTKGMPIKGRVKTTAELEDELNEACSSSWKSNLSLPSSFTDKLSSSLSSSFKSSRSGHDPSKLNQVQNGSDQPVNATSASHWKHPGTAAPAPAVVVSAVAAPDGTELSHHEYDYSETRVVPTKVDSETSSTAATTAQPSRTTTPIESLTQKPTAIRHDSLKANSAQDSALSILPSAPSQTKATPSLLTQTAPSKLTVLPRLKRPSPSTPVSQLTVNTRDSSASTPIPPAGQSTTTKSTDVTLPVAIPSDATPPAAPPPTPVESLMVSANLTVTPNSSSALAYQAVSPIDVPLYEVPEPPVLPDIFVKIADLGNATPSKKHYTEEIQTRQYRAPEAILGKRDWDARADIWSVACVIFELLTAEYLFDPHGQGEHFSKDDDHMAQIIELVGDFALEAKMGGRYSREIFDHTGALRYIRALKPWPLKRVMTEKYLYSDAHSDALCAFLLPMLEPNIKKRAHARDLLEHPWLQPAPDDELVTEW